MTDQTLADAIVPFVSAAIAFLDTDAAFGVDHERTREAKLRLRIALDTFVAKDADGEPTQLLVIRGGMRDDAG